MLVLLKCIAHEYLSHFGPNIFLFSFIDSGLSITYVTAFVKCNIFLKLHDYYIGRHNAYL